MSERLDKRKTVLTAICFVLSAVVSLLFVNTGAGMRDAYLNGILSREGFMWLHVLIAFITLLVSGMCFVSARRAKSKLDWIFMAG